LYHDNSNVLVSIQGIFAAKQMQVTTPQTLVTKHRA